MNKKILLLLFVPIFLLGCSTVNTINSPEVFRELIIGPEIEVGDIQITDHKNLNGDIEQARVFLENIISSKGHSNSGTPDYLLELTIKEQSFTKKIDQLYTIAVTMNIRSVSSETLVYRGILITESDVPVESAYQMFSVLEECYSEFTAKLPIPEDEK